MFDEDLTLLSTADLLESSAEHRALADRADARCLEHALIYADRFHPDAVTPRPGRRSFEGRECAVVLGGEGCPPIAEFAIGEYAAVHGVSHRTGARIIGDALALRHRFPFTWARVLSGEATPWKACRLVRDCVDLSEEAARYVDERVAALIDTITPYRLDKIVKAAKMHIDPEGARAEAAAKVRERGVFIGRSDEHGTKTIYIRTSSGAATRFDATIHALSDAQQAIGDTRSGQFRRAEAVGIIADPVFAQELLAQAHQTTASTPDSSAPEAPNPGTAASSTAATASGCSAPASNGSPTGLRDVGPGLRGVGPELQRRDCGVLGGDWDEVSVSINEPGLDDEADRDARFDTGPDHERDDGEPLDAAAQCALAARLAQIKQDAYARLAAATAPGDPVRPAKTEIYVHLTDRTLATAATGAGDGVVRAEGIGPMLVSQLGELIGYGPYIVKPVIDLNDAISVNCYEASDSVRERVKLTHPVELFPYGTRETNRSIDLDHLEPYDPLGPPGQTSTTNLVPLSRYGHRVKTHAHGWRVRRISPSTLEWTTPHGFVFHVDQTGTHRIVTTEH